MLQWYRKPPSGMNKYQEDWNQTLISVINSAVKSVQEKKALNIGKGRMFKTQVEPQLSCPENMKEIFSTLEFYDSEKNYIPGVNTNSFIRPNIYVDFKNEHNHIIYYRHDHTIAIELIDENQPD